MIALDVGFIAAALAAGVAIGARWTRERAIVAEVDRDLAHLDAVEAQDTATLLAVENMRLQGDVADLWRANDAGQATLAEVRVELEAVEECHHEQRERADKAEARSAAWELRAQHLATALEQFVPREVEAGGNVVLFPDRAAG